jgi:hypothetical protein
MPWPVIRPAGSLFLVLAVIVVAAASVAEAAAVHRRGGALRQSRNTVSSPCKYTFIFQERQVYLQCFPTS